MAAFSYWQSNQDHTLSFKRKDGKITTFIIYVDDMIVIRDDPKERRRLQEHLSKDFEMRDLGCMNWGFKIKGGNLLESTKICIGFVEGDRIIGCKFSPT